MGSHMDQMNQYVLQHAPYYNCEALRQKKKSQHFILSSLATDDEYGITTSLRFLHSTTYQMNNVP